MSLEFAFGIDSAKMMNQVENASLPLLQKNSKLLGINYLGSRSPSLERSLWDLLYVAVEVDEWYLLLKCSLKGTRCIFLPATFAWPIHLRLVMYKTNKEKKDLCVTPIDDLLLSEKRLIDKWFIFKFDNDESGVMERVEIHLQFSYTSPFKSTVTAAGGDRTTLSEDNEVLLDVLNNSALMIPLAIYGTSSITTADRDAEILMLLLEVSTNMHFLRRLIHVDTSPMATEKVNERLLLTDSQLLECMNLNISRFLRAYAKIIIINEIIRAFSPLMKNIVDSVKGIDFVKDFIERATLLLHHFAPGLLRIMADTFEDFCLNPLRTACVCVVVHCFSVGFLMPVEFGLLADAPSTKIKSQMMGIWKKVIFHCLTFSGLKPQGFTATRMDGLNGDEGHSLEYIKKLESLTDHLSRTKPFSSSELAQSFYPFGPPSVAMKAIACSTAKFVLKERIPSILKSGTYGDSMSLLLSRINYLTNDDSKKSISGPIPPPPTEDSSFLRQFAENAVIYEGPYAFRDVQQRIAYLLTTQRQTSRRRLIKKSVPIVKRSSTMLSPFIARNRSSLEQLQRLGILPMDYISQIFPDISDSPPQSYGTPAAHMKPQSGSSETVGFHTSTNAKSAPSQANVGEQAPSIAPLPLQVPTECGEVAFTLLSASQSQKGAQLYTTRTEDAATSLLSCAETPKWVDGRKETTFAEETSPLKSVIRDTNGERPSVNTSTRGVSHPFTSDALLVESDRGQKASSSKPLTSSKSAGSLFNLTQPLQTSFASDTKATNQTLEGKTVEAAALDIAPPPVGGSSIPYPLTHEFSEWPPLSIPYNRYNNDAEELPFNASHNDYTLAILNSLPNSQFDHNQEGSTPRYVPHSLPPSTNEIQDYFRDLQDSIAYLSIRLEKERSCRLILEENLRHQSEWNLKFRQKMRVTTFSPPFDASPAVYNVSLSDQQSSFVSSPFLQVIKEFVKKQLKGDMFNHSNGLSEPSLPSVAPALPMRKQMKWLKYQNSNSLNFDAKLTNTNTSSDPPKEINKRSNGYS